MKKIMILFSFFIFINASNATNSTCVSTNPYEQILTGIGASAGGTAGTSIMALIGYKLLDKYVFPIISKGSSGIYSSLKSCISFIRNREDPLETLLKKSNLSSDVSTTLFDLCKYWRNLADEQIDDYKAKKYESSDIVKLVNYHENLDLGVMMYRFPTSEVSLDLKYNEHGSFRKFSIKTSDIKNSDIKSSYIKVGKEDNPKTDIKVLPTISKDMKNRILNSVSDVKLRSKLNIKIDNWFKNNFITRGVVNRNSDHIILYFGHYTIGDEDKPYFKPDGKFEVKYRSATLNIKNEDIFDDSEKNNNDSHVLVIKKAMGVEDNEEIFRK